MLFKTCTKCKRVIKLNSKCYGCLKSYNKNYDTFVRDDKSRNFYNSTNWLKLRKLVLNTFNHLDIYEYFINNKIVKADTVHHIVPIKDNLNLALDECNLIPLANGTHTIIHKLYDKSHQDKLKTQNLLREIRSKFLSRGDM